MRCDVDAYYHQLHLHVSMDGSISVAGLSWQHSQNLRNKGLKWLHVMVVACGRRRCRSLPAYLK
jgi:hypothetical protein